ncbi:ABC transporter ATP-binding protein [Rhizobiaceae bacterium BDR2-2]|uniref:ABC transporter ATP-binding protein n=1 Tax=Ectorhizobium quercum TaxID=2965071 RepID=A0AAE3N009_9HYPH|nr:ABC transporter ATP-binding protein [Ectorhizobium quercum]MCX8997482.1 ABC transporter ATP-binding protein [Ectorhizobium quercum]
MILVAENLGWSAGRTEIVSGIDLEIRKGERLGLVGPNGSGKSTLLKLIAGIRSPGRGRVLLKGKPLSAMRRGEIARTIALVEQQADTGERINVRDAVELGRTPWLSALQPWSEKDDAIVEEALAAVSMTAFAKRSWATLSGGERQRVHIARALAQRPEILLLDEPANHLDVHHQLAILRLVFALPVTTVVALHDLNQALECDRIGVMDRGRLVALGPPADVLTADCLHGIFGVGASVLTDPADGARVFRFRTLS